MSRFTVGVMIEKVAVAAGLDVLGVHCHTLRHSCGYALVNKNTNLRTIQSYLGHKSISGTIRYTKLNGSQFKGLF